MLKNLGKKEKIQLTITGIGIVFLIFLVMGNVGKGQTKKRSMEKTGETVASSLSVPISFEVSQIEESLIKQGWGRDPFFLGPESTEDIELDGLILNGIMWDENSPYAIINNDVVEIGAKLGTMIVIEITDSNVILEQKGKRYTLDLPAL